MSTRSKRIIIAVVILVIVAILAWVFFLLRAVKIPMPPGVGASSPAIPSLPPVVPPTPLGAVAPSGAHAEVAQAGIEAFARSFVERYGSFSSQSNFENLEDLYPFMTVSFQGETKASVARLRKQQSGGLPQYSGVTTRVMSVKKNLVSADEAKLLISTQRQNSGTNSVITYQDIALTLLKVEGQWKVDAAGWK